MTTSSSPNKWISRATLVAARSDAKFKLGAVAVDEKGKIVSEASNTRKTHPVQARYASRAGLPHKQSLHAEMCALVKATQSIHSLVVVRINRQGMLRNACPCSICTQAIVEADVKRVIYSIWDDTQEWWVEP